MPPTQTPNAGALLETAIASAALTQLNHVAIYPRVATRDYELGAFARGNVVRIRRPKRRRAVDLDPRTGGFNFTEAEFFSGEVKLERLWTDGFLMYGHDSQQTMALYLAETASQISDAIITPNDEYLYTKFRDWSPFASVLSTGAYALGDTPPFNISFCIKDDGTLTEFNNEGLRGASVFLDKENAGNDRYAVISSSAKGAFLGDSIAIEGSKVEAEKDPLSQLIIAGIRQGQFVERYGFRLAGSNTVGGQTGTPDLDTVAGIQGTLPISASAANTQLSYADFSSTYGVGSLIGAVDITLTAGTALPPSIAVGKIARLAPGTPNKSNVFYGVILRVNLTTPTAPIVTMVPYKWNGQKIPATGIIPGTYVFSVPDIPSVNTVNTTEGLLMANRFLREPRLGSGAVAASIRDPQTNNVIQVFTGNYDLGTVSEKNAAYMLTGAKISDCRKTGLILSL
jgi:hypothetical protein